MNAVRTSILLLGLLTVSGTAAAGLIHVDAGNESGVEDGTSAFPYTTIQAGINHAVSGDKVIVAAGIYKETVLMANGVSLLGAGWRDTVIDATDLPNSAVTFDGTPASPMLSGFTITGGRGDQRSDIGGEPVTIGGGILILNSSPVIAENRIIANVLDEGYCLGGGIYVDAQAATPVIRDNIFVGNVAMSATVAGSGKGGAIYVAVKDGGAIIRGNRIEGNLAVEGGGILVENFSNAAVILERNKLENNQAVTGAAAWLSDADGSTTQVVNNEFTGNGSDTAAAAGGGVFAQAAGTGFFRIVNNTLVDHSLPQGSGAALALDDSVATNSNSLVANNVIAGNLAVNGSLDHTAFSGTIRSNDFHDNTGGDLYDGGGSTATLIDNLFVDPQFVLTHPNTYRLQPTSPLIDVAADAEAPAQDLDGFGRPFDGDGDATAQSDFGAYEFPNRDIELRFTGESVIEWDVLSLQESYDVYRGSLARLRATGEYTQDAMSEPLATQFCGVLPGSVPFVESFQPASGELVHYLVTLSIGAWQGGLGQDSQRLTRANDNACPLSP